MVKVEVEEEHQNVPLADTKPGRQVNTLYPTQPKPPRNCYTGLWGALGSLLGGFGSLPCCCCFPRPYKNVQQGQVGLISEFGRFIRIAEPGLVYVNPFTETLKVVDLRVRVQILPQQVIVTHDNVSVRVDSVLYWRVFDAAASIFLVDDMTKALIERALTTMREVCSVRDLQDMLTRREAMAQEIKQTIEGIAYSWGIEIEAILIKDIIMGQDLQENLSAAAVAKRQGASKVITAQAEVEAARLMREASDIMATPAAMQFRYLETLQKMSAHAQTRVIFVPTSNDVTRFSAMAPSGTDTALTASLMQNM